jgi:hypothetical protein
VPTTFHGISKDKATNTKVTEACQPLAGMDKAKAMPSGISNNNTAEENTSCRHKASCKSWSRITAANHSVPTNTRRSGEMMSCTE